jgi:hypothetical protein
MQSGCRVGPVGASFSAGCLSMPLWGVRGAPAGAPGTDWVVRESGSALHLRRAVQGQFLERGDATNGRVCILNPVTIDWDLLPPCSVSD